MINIIKKYWWIGLIAGEIKKGKWKFDKSDEEILHFLAIDGIKTNGGISYG